MRVALLPIQPRDAVVGLLWRAVGEHAVTQLGGDAGGVVCAPTPTFETDGHGAGISAQQSTD